MYFLHMIYVTGIFFRYIFFWSQANISDDLINFWDGSIKNKMAAAAIKRNN